MNLALCPAVAVIATGAALLLPCGPAAAEPGEFPDLDGYSAVNAADFQTYGNYPYTSGVQFTTPDGYRCRMAFTGKGNVWHTGCWGALPGTAANHAEVIFQGPGPARAALDDTDLSALEHYREMGADRRVIERTVDPAAYRVLPAGSKVTFENQTCAVDVDVTACVLRAGGDPHGFVLSRQGSRVF